VSRSFLRGPSFCVPGGKCRDGSGWNLPALTKGESLQLVDLAEQHRADAMAAAERGRLVCEVRRARQQRARGMGTMLAVRDIGRRLWGWRLAHSPGREFDVAEAAVLSLLSDGIEVVNVSADAGAAAGLAGNWPASEALGAGRMFCRRTGVPDRRAQVRTNRSANGRRGTDQRLSRQPAGRFLGTSRE